ncbi:elongation factor 2 kinase [Apiospora rasikravindrae]|uniref:Elongation factor 2 kinase n=1 Tax=Apiospora rasikravindrae TaxID=990691 RepID=A0ABR1TE04_9PEZI
MFRRPCRMFRKPCRDPSASPFKPPGSSESPEHVKIKRKVYAEGTYKSVCKGRFIAGPRAGQACVAKTFRNPKYGSFAEQWAGERQAMRTAQQIVEAFNHAMVIKEELRVLAPDIMTCDDGTGERRMVEPLIRRYVKNNNNAGWVNPSGDPWNLVMQALSHFSYHATGGRFLLCDVQGGSVGNVYSLTDLAVHSETAGRFGLTDNGKHGFVNFFKTHCCNSFCRPYWLKIEKPSGGPISTPCAPERKKPRWKVPARVGCHGIF